MERRQSWHKRWWKSLTLWVNSVSGFLILVLAALQDSVPLLREVFSPDMYQITLFTLAFVNILLRLRTTQPIAVKKPTPEAEL